MASQRSGSSSPSSGDHYDSETAGASYWSLRMKARRRQLWTSCRRRFTSERRSSRLKMIGRVRPRQEARLVCSAICQHKTLLRIFTSFTLRSLPARAFDPHFPAQASRPPLSPAPLGFAQSSLRHAIASVLCYSRFVHSFASACILDLGSE